MGLSDLQQEDIDSGVIPISVVVPVYNKEQSLQRCFDSIDRQMKRGARFEVVFIDDGSQDNSLAMCEKYAEGKSNIKVFSQENGGVSVARNKGIELAQGEFLLFLDADDAISEGAIGKIQSFIAEFGNQVDVISYPLVYFNPITDSTSRHKREKWLTERTVYALSDAPFVAQTTMNVCVRRSKALEVKFNPAIKMGEDQLFITQCLVEKGKIGNCIDAEYWYTRDGQGLSSKRNNPLYAFEDMMALFEYFEELGRTSESMGEYAYQMLLYGFNWRIRANMLFPAHLVGEEREVAESRLRAVLKKVPVKSIVRSPYLGRYLRAYYIKEFTDAACPVVSARGKKLRMDFEDGTRWKVPQPTLTLMRAVEDGGKIHVMGRISSAAFAFTENPRLFYTDPNGESKELDLRWSSYSFNGTKEKVIDAWLFELDLSTGEIEGTRKYAFSYSIGEEQHKRLAIRFGGLRRHNARVTETALYFPSAVFSVTNNKIVLSKPRSNRWLRELSMERKAETSSLIRRASIRRNKKSRPNQFVWLYSDLPTSVQAGNALAQIKHDLKKDDGIQRFYVTDLCEEAVALHPFLAGHVVERGSKEHLSLFVSAKVVLASYLEWFTFMPVSRDEYDCIGDLCGNKRYVYLQHGVLHAHMPWYCSYDRIWFDDEVVSTQFEIDNLTSNYVFKEKNLIASGMSRLDEATVRDTESAGPVKVLYVPSWRSYLVHGSGDDRSGDDGAMRASSLYKGMAELFDLIAEGSESESFDFSVKLHPNFSCYDHLFDEFREKGITFLEDAVDPGDYDLVVTDFSSYVYDFVYVGCSVVYFLPDEVEFRAGLNHYSKLDLPFSEGFGPYSADAAETYRFVVQTVNEIREGAETDRRKKIESFFLYRDKSNCERIYQSLAGEDR